MKKAAIAVAVLSFAVTGVALLPGSPALAANCKTNSITTGYRTAGTVVTKFNGTCNDLNITNTDDKKLGWDRYAGFYKSGSTWVVGTRGYIELYDGAHDDVVVLSDVRSGTQVSVGSFFDPGDVVKVKH